MISEKIKHMIFIDDDPINNFLMKTRLDEYGYQGEVTFFDSAFDALDFLKQFEKSDSARHPGVIFLDIKMPGMDGFEFLEAYKQQELDAKIISKIVIVSSSNNSRDRQRSRESGLVAAFVEKPLSVEKIDELAQAHLD